MKRILNLKSSLWTFRRFLEPGVYYYAGSGSVLMKGVIKVLPAFRTQAGLIRIKIDGMTSMFHFHYRLDIIQ